MPVQYRDRRFHPAYETSQDAHRDAARAERDAMIARPCRVLRPGARVLTMQARG